MHPTADPGLCAPDLSPMRNADPQHQAAAGCRPAEPCRAPPHPPTPPLHSCTSQHSPFPTLQFAHLPGKGRAVQGAGCCVLLASCGLAGSHTCGSGDSDRGDFSHGASGLGVLRFPKGQGILLVVSLVRALTVCVYPGTSPACSASSGVWEIAMLWFASSRVSSFPFPRQEGLMELGGLIWHHHFSTWAL